MLSTLKMFEFSVKNTRTGESTAFLGQGTTVEAAFKDGAGNVIASFRPSSDGKKRPAHGLAVTCKDGVIRSRTLGEFEGDEAYTEQKTTP